MICDRFQFLLLSVLSALAAACQSISASEPRPVVEAEDIVYSYEPANNGAGPLWCSGSTCLVRQGNDVFASGLETIKDVKPLNNCRWLLFKRGQDRWELQQSDSTGRTREPAPLTIFNDGRLFLSANPTLTPLNTYSGPARPEILQFSKKNPEAPFVRLLPVWQDTPKFSEHSYRSFAADAPKHELILFQNIDYTHAEWTFRDHANKWVAQGKLLWPQGTNYPKPGPIRVCYPDVALRNRSVHFCGVSDIIEPYPEWRAFKKQLTGQEWDYDFRRLFYTWTPDITREKFHDWIEIASRDRTCGWVMPGDLWAGPDGSVHIVWSERALDERLRPRFFPEARQTHSINYAVIQDGQVVSRRVLLLAEEGKPGLIPGAPRLQAASNHRLFLVYYVQGTDPAGKRVSENRLMQLWPGNPGPEIKLPLKSPFTSYFTATVRGGSPPSKFLEMLGQREAAPSSICYARIRLW